MINILVKEIVLYNDEIEIALNYTNNKYPDDVNRQDITFYSTYKNVEINTAPTAKEKL